MTILNAHGKHIAKAIRAGINAMTATRWAEEASKAANFEDEGEWFTPEFGAARDATECVGGWDFAGWRETLDGLESTGKIGGMDFRHLRWRNLEWKKRSA